MTRLTFGERWKQALDNEPPVEVRPKFVPDPRDDEHKIAEPDEWVSNLGEPFRRLAHILGSGRSSKGKVTFLIGPRGSGKSLLLTIAHRFAKDTKGVEGELTSGLDLLFHDEGVHAVERLALEWQRKRNNDRLDYLMVDDASWTSILRGRLHQLTEMFGEDRPSIIFVLDYFQFRDMVKFNPRILDHSLKIEIPPYTADDLRFIWSRYFGQLHFEDDDITDAIMDHAMMLPEILIDQGVYLSKASVSETITRSSVSRFWEDNWYARALELRKQKFQKTRRDILIRLAQHEGLSATGLSREFSIDRSACSYHLGNLQEEGWIASERRGTSVLYYVPKPMAAAIEISLVRGLD